MRNKLGFLWVAGVFALALVFGACDSGEYTYNDESGTFTATMTLESGKKWTYEETYSGVTEKANGTYEKVDSMYYFIVEGCSPEGYAEIGEVFMQGVKAGKTLILNGTAYKKAIDGDVTIKIIGELED
ncbi:MAG: hypothetical protein Ta2G_21590 [Termitinemataceae bacterium]|nr:MAG: hypothetical protein Ta2G_21590 [Termitinemataceae bacterium]